MWYNYWNGQVPVQYYVGEGTNAKKTLWGKLADTLQIMGKAKIMILRSGVADSTI
jgi:hypothetical protein